MSAEGLGGVPGDRPGERVKTNRRDAVMLARLFRAGELTEIWTPDEAHEAMRDLVRAREAAFKDDTRKRQKIRSFLLRHGKVYPGKQISGTKYFQWFQDLSVGWPDHSARRYRRDLGGRPDRTPAPLARRRSHPAFRPPQPDWPASLEHRCRGERLDSGTGQTASRWRHRGHLEPPRQKDRTWQ